MALADDIRKFLSQPRVTNQTFRVPGVGQGFNNVKPTPLQQAYRPQPINVKPIVQAFNNNPQLQTIRQLPKVQVQLGQQLQRVNVPKLNQAPNLMTGLPGVPVLPSQLVKPIANFATNTFNTQIQSTGRSLERAGKGKFASKGNKIEDVGNAMNFIPAIGGTSYAGKLAIGKLAAQENKFGTALRTISPALKGIGHEGFFEIPIIDRASGKVVKRLNYKNLGDATKAMERLVVGDNQIAMGPREMTRQIDPILGMQSADFSKGRKLKDDSQGLYQIIRSGQTPEESIGAIKELSNEALQKGDTATFQALKKAATQFKKDLVTGPGKPRDPMNQPVIEALDEILSKPLKTVKIKGRGAEAGLYDTEKQLKKLVEAPGIGEGTKPNPLKGTYQYQTVDINRVGLGASPDSRESISSAIRAIKEGKKLPPVTVKAEVSNTGYMGKPEVNYTIIDGNHRLAAYQQMGIKDIPVLVKQSDQGSKILNADEFFSPRVAQQPIADTKVKLKAKMPTAQQIDKEINGGITLKPSESKPLQVAPLELVKPKVNSVATEANPLISGMQDTKLSQAQPQIQKVQSQPQPNIQGQVQSQADSLDGIIAQAKKEISSGTPKIDKRTIREFADDVYTSWVDRFHPITKLAGQVEKNLKTAGAELRPEFNPRYTIKRFLGAGGIAENRFDNEFRPILKEIDDLKIPKDELDVYLKARRDVGFGEVGRQIYGSDPVVGQARVIALEAKYGEGIKQVSDKIYAYQNKMFQELVDGGFINAEKAKLIRGQNPDYVPFFRDMENLMDDYLGIPSQKLQQATNPVTKIKGSDKKILSPIESIIANTYRYRAAIEKNNVAKSITGLQKVMPDLKFNKVAQSGRDTITVWENGQKNYYQVGADIADTVKGMNEEQMNSLLKILSVPSSILRQGATGRNPAFMIPNMIRDQLDAAINSKYGYIPFVDYARGLSHLLKKDEIYQKWQQSGSQIALGELSGRKSVNQLFQEKQGKKKFFSWITKGLDTAGKYSEQPTRLGLYAKAYKKTGNELLANMESREGTLDFARMGSKMKVANSLIPFLNVGVQGFDKMARTAKANPGRFTVKMAAYGAVPTIATTLWNVQNFPQEYKEIPQWEKNSNFIIVTGRAEDGTVDYISIPKGNIIQYISNPIENFISYSADTDSQSVQQMATLFLSSSLPVIGDGSTVKEVALKTVGSNLPQAIKPVTENLMNKSFYKYDSKNNASKEIVPYYLKDKAPGDQSYDFTPGAYKTIGKTLNVSPLLVQNFLEGTFAGYVKEPLSVYETFKSIADGESVDRNKAFILRRFLKHTYPTSASKSSSGLGTKYEVAQAPESGMLNSASASGFSNPFKKKEQPKPSGRISEVSWESEAGRKTTVKLDQPQVKKTGIDAFNNENINLTNARKIFNAPPDQVNESDKIKVYKQLGYTKQELEYDHKSGSQFNTDERVAYINSQNLSHDQLIQRLITGRVISIGGNQFATDAVLKELLDQNLISGSEYGNLKKIKTDKEGKSLVKAKIGGGRAKKVKIAKYPSSLPKSTLKIKKTKFSKLKAGKNGKLLEGSKKYLKAKPKKSVV